jgi:hypothetical protein
MQKLDRNIGFRETHQFLSENLRKSQKIAIITSIPGANPTTTLYNKKFKK